MENGEGIPPGATCAQFEGRHGHLAEAYEGDPIVVHCKPGAAESGTVFTCTRHGTFSPTPDYDTLCTCNVACVSQAAECAVHNGCGCMDQTIAWEEASYKTTTVSSLPRLPMLSPSQCGSALLQKSGIECQDWRDTYPHLHGCNSNSAFTGIKQTAASVGSALSLFCPRPMFDIQDNICAQGINVSTTTPLIARAPRSAHGVLHPIRTSAGNSAFANVPRSLSASKSMEGKRSRDLARRHLWPVLGPSRAPRGGL